MGGDQGKYSDVSDDLPDLDRHDRHRESRVAVELALGSRRECHLRQESLEDVVDCRELLALEQEFCLRSLAQCGQHYFHHLSNKKDGRKGWSLNGSQCDHTCGIGNVHEDRLERCLARVTSETQKNALEALFQQ